MADESSAASGDKLDAVLKKIERESRFTRSLVVICTAAILGVSLVPVKIMLTDFPKLLVTEFMAELEVVHDHWALLDQTFKRRSGSGSGAGSGAESKSEQPPAADTTDKKAP